MAYSSVGVPVYIRPMLQQIREIRDFVKSLLNSWNDWIGELRLGLGLGTNNPKANFHFSHFTNSLVISRNPWFHEFTVTYTQPQDCECRTVPSDFLNVATRHKDRKDLTGYIMSPCCPTFSGLWGRCSAEHAAHPSVRLWKSFFFQTGDYVK